MAKLQTKERNTRPCHFGKMRFEPTTRWYTACGLVLDKTARAEVVIADEWKHVTCKKCQEKDPT